MLSSVLLKYKKALIVNSGSIAARTENNEGLGLFLIIFNISGIAFLSIMLFLKFVLPKTAEEKKKMGTNIIDLFTGRKKRNKSKAGEEECGKTVEGIDDGNNIELGSVYNAKRNKSGEDILPFENPIREKAEAKKEFGSIKILKVTTNA
jgi:hypothetical protein